MKQIIINADDFGINEVVTSEIERMILGGSVSSTSVMANGVCLGEVRKFASEHPEVSFGVHLCLSEFDSITKSEALYRAGLIDEKGSFIPKAIFHLDNLTEIEVQKAIRDELNAQIDVVSSLNFPISHADSHHHIHTIYPLRHTITEVLKSRNIEKVRICVGYYSLRSKFRFTSYLRHLCLNHYYSSRFITTKSFINYSGYINGGLGFNSGQTIELMCHPGHPAKRYQDEMRLVEAKSALSPNVRLISYNDLHR